MSKFWNLSALYPSFDDPSVDKDIKELTSLIQDVDTLFENITPDTILSSKEVLHIIGQLSKIAFIHERLGAFARLTSSVDVTNSAAKKLGTVYDSFLPSVKKALTSFQTELCKVDDLDAMIASEPKLEEYSFFIKENALKMEHSPGKNEEKVIAMMQNSGSTSWMRLHNELLSTLVVEVPEELAVDGETHLPITVIRNFGSSANATTRRLGYECEKKGYERIALAMAAAMNGIKAEAITLADLRKFDSPFEMTLFDSRMDPEILDALISSMEESLPMMREFLKKKASVLGHEKGLPMYDLLAPLGKSTKRFTYEEAQEFVIQHFSSYSTELADYAKKAFENDWIDVEPRKGKKGGGFCSNLSIGESRILLNFDGSIGSVITLAHELGHGYHGHCLKDMDYLNRTYTMPIAETASTFCETIALNGALASLDDSEKLGILDSQARRNIAIIMDIYSRFIFEKKVFEERTTEPLSQERLCELMAWAQKEAYGDGVDHEYNNPYAWVNKPHYYFISRNFYNFPYAFGLLFARGLYSIYQKEGEAFLPKYNKLLAATGSCTIKELGETIGLDLTSKDFYRQGLKSLEEDILTLSKLI